MFERALVILYLSQSRNKTISGIRMKNSIFESYFGKMLLTWVTLLISVRPNPVTESETESESESQNSPNPTPNPNPESQVVILGVLFDF